MVKAKKGFHGVHKTKRYALFEINFISNVYVFLNNVDAYI